MSNEATTEGTEEPGRNPIDTALDLAVFAPLGFALECRRIVPELAEVGRRQVAFSQSLGRAALRTLARSAAASAPPKHASSADAAPNSGANESAPPPQPSVDREYGTRTAREIIAQVATLSRDEVEAMQALELQGKRRKTVLAAFERRLADDT